MLNHSRLQLFKDSEDSVVQLRCQTGSVVGARFLDAGINSAGSLQAGMLVARLCLGDQAEVRIVSADAQRLASNNAVEVRTDMPLEACLGSQYAGWPVQTDDYFAMGSGPMRMARGREPALEQLGLSELPQQVVGVLESDKLPTESAVQLIAEQCGVGEAAVHLAIAPTTSIAGSLQVVARSIETAMHKLHELNFDVRTIVSGNRTRAAATASETWRHDRRYRTHERCNAVRRDGHPVGRSRRRRHCGGRRPSSQQFVGRSWATIRKDLRSMTTISTKSIRMLFSPAVVTIHNLRSGRTWNRGAIETEVLRQSFLS